MWTRGKRVHGSPVPGMREHVVTGPVGSLGDRNPTSSMPPEGTT